MPAYAAYVSIRQHTSVQSCVRISQHTAAYASIRSIRQHTPAYVSAILRPHKSAYGNICQHASAYALVSASKDCRHESCVSIRQHMPACVSIRAGQCFKRLSPHSIREHTLAYAAYVSIRQHTPAYVSIRQCFKRLSPRALRLYEALSH
jgi:hypothetical protein